MLIAFLPKIGYGRYDFPFKYHGLKGNFKRKDWNANCYDVMHRTEKEKADGLGLGSHCDGNLDFSGPGGHRVRIEGRMALAGRSPWDWGPFPEHEKHSCLGHNDHRDPHPGDPLLFHPSLDPGVCQGLFYARPSDCGRVLLPSKI